MPSLHRTTPGVVSCSILSRFGPCRCAAQVKLATLKDERAHRNWHKLGNTDGEQDEHERGEVELCLRWCHDKARAYDLPKEFKQTEKAGTKAMPNELHVYLVRARDLEVMDSGLLGKGSSDPIVVLDVMGTSHKSTQKKKELNPVWLESFSWPVEDDEAVLEVTVEDYDMTGNDFMGPDRGVPRSCSDIIRAFRTQAGRRYPSRRFQTERSIASGTDSFLKS